MKAAAVAGFLASVLYSQQAVATYGWNDAQSFSNPDNSNNKCVGDQSGGWDFGKVPTGQVGSYDGFQFSGFSCQDGFNARSGRRGMKKRTQFDGKAIVGQATKDDASCPKISGQDKDFSITEMHVSTDKDADLTFEYDMPDGSTCKQKTRCSTDGTVVKNSQCGGAKQVKVKGSTIDKGVCVPTPPSTTTVPTTTPATTTPQTTTPLTTSTCSEGSTMDKGVCVPRTFITTTTACAATESKDGTGKCVPTGGVTTTSTCGEGSTIDSTKSVCVPKTPTGGITSTTTTTCAEGSTMDTTKSVCVPKTPTGGITTTSTGGVTTITTTTACGEGSTMDTTKSVCVPKTPTGGITTTTTAACVTTETLSGGVCVPTTTPAGSTTTSCGPSSAKSNGVCVPVVTPPSCKDDEEVKDGKCGPKGPTGGSTLPTSTPLATTACSSGSTMDKGSCVAPPTGGSTTTIPATTPGTSLPLSSTTTTGQTTTSTVVCKDDEETKDGKCVKKPTGGITSSTSPSSTPVATTSSTSAPSCKDDEEFKDSKCVKKPTGGVTSSSSTPIATTSTTTTSAVTCQGDEEFKDGKCVKKPTGGLTTRSSTTLATSSSTTALSSNETPIPEAGCPDVLPRCFSTWMQKAGSCSSNSDISCFCPSPDFISSVQDCVSAWGGSDANVQAAFSYLAGICADFVPKNPGICTGIPSSITLVPRPTPAPSTSVPVTGGSGAPPAPTKPAEIPSTVITFTRTETSTIITQTVTVPQVSFNTITQQAPVTGGATSNVVPTSTQGVGLVPALPVTTPAASSSAPDTWGAWSSPSSSAATPIAAQTSTTAFVPSTSSGVPATKTGNSPISTFTGAANKPAYAIAAGLFGVVAFLA
ncbi:hypothetical protein LTR64_007768 [Lithohypha guttulata]|uniref:uncharacterized protein n=1 Tax=Lithohypha guttulata TaxID=1690604 RepID=UPI002DDE02C9|nr:hypothetical protein LTR51_007279 [Lithohypha guttulata]